MPVTFSTNSMSLTYDIGGHNLPLNGTFEDLRGLTDLGGGTFQGDPFGWNLSGANIVDAEGQGLLLGTGSGTAQTAFGVLSNETLIEVEARFQGVTAQDYSYLETLAVQTASIGVVAEILIGGSVVASQYFTLAAPERQNATNDLWIAYVDMEEVDLAAYTLGETPVELRIKNVTEDSYAAGVNVPNTSGIVIDDVRSEQAVQAEVFASGTVDLSSAAGTVSVDNVVISGPGYDVIDADGFTEALFVERKGDYVEWTFATSKDALGVLATGDVLDVTFDITIEDGGVPDTVAVTLSLIGGNDAPQFEEAITDLSPSASFTNDAVTLTEDAAEDGLRLINPADPGARFALDTYGGAGELEVLFDGTILYTPADPAPQSDSFDLTMTTRTLTVTPPAEAGGEPVVSASESVQNLRVLVAVSEQDGTPLFDFSVAALDAGAEVATDVIFDAASATHVTGFVSATDVDEGDSFGFAVISGPAKGAVSVDENTGQFVYHPNEHAVGEDSFTVQVTDAGGLTDEKTVSVMIGAVNDAPALIGDAPDAQSHDLLRDGVAHLFLGDMAFADPDGDKADMTLILSGHAGKGTLEVSSDFLSGNDLVFDAETGAITGSQSDLQKLLSTIGVITYTDTTGEDVAISLSVTDNGSTEGAAETTALGTIDLAVFNTPVAEDLTVDGLPEDVAANGLLPGSDADGDPLTFAIALDGAPQNGTVEIFADGTFTFTPKGDFYGTDQFTYTVSDGQASATGTVVLNYFNLPDAPILNDELILMDAGTTAKGSLDGTGTGDEQVSYRLAEGGAPEHGTLVIGEDGHYTYQPDEGFSGIDRFGFVGAADGIDGVGFGQVYVFADKNAPLIAGLIIEDINEAGQRSGRVDALDPNRDAIGFSVAEGDAPENGALSVTLDGRFVYTPDEGFDGIDSFTVTVTDGTHVSTKEVSISAAGTNVAGRLTGTEASDLLIGTSGGDVIVPFGSGEAADTILAGDGDDDILLSPAVDTALHVDGGKGTDRIVITPGEGAADLTGLSVTGVEQIIGSGEGVRFDGALNLSHVPTVSQLGTIEGGEGNDTYAGGSLPDTFDGAGGVDTMVYPGSVTDYVVTRLGLNQAEITNSQGLTDTVENVERLVFDDYTYFLDGTDNAPIAGTDLAAVTDGTETRLSLSDVTGNDLDLDGGAISVAAAAGSEMIDAQLDGDELVLTATEAAAALAEGETQETTASYTLTNDKGVTATGTIDVTLTGINDAPVANADTNETGSYSQVTGNVLTNDTDADNGAVLSVSDLDGGREYRAFFSGLTAAGAKVKLFKDGSYTYDARGAFADVAEGDVVQDTFTYTVSDGLGGTSTQTVTIDVTGEAAPSLGDFDYLDAARGGSLVVEEQGLLRETLATSGGEIFAVEGAERLEIHEIVEGEVVVNSAFRVDGAGGGTFIIDADGSFRFDPGKDFDDLLGDATRKSEAAFSVRLASGNVLNGVASVDVRASDYAPTIETTLTEATAPENTAELVEGTFEQQGPVDIIGEFFNRINGLIDFDLNDLLDMKLIDIDTVIRTSYNPQTGLSVSIDDVSVNTDAVITGLGDKLSPAADFVTDIFESAYSLPLSPIYFGPQFDTSLGIQMELGWDVDLPSLGKTAVFQPISVNLNTPGTPVTSGSAFLISSDQLVSQTPTTVLQTVGLGGMTAYGSASITEATLTSAGLSFGTANFLGLNFDDVVSGSITLEHDFDLIEILKSLGGGELPPGPNGEPMATPGLEFVLSLSLGELLNAAMAVDLQEVLDAIQAVIDDPSFETVTELGKLFLDGLAAIADSGGNLINIGDGVAVTPYQLISLNDRVLFNDFDGTDAQGRAYIEIENLAGDIVQKTGPQIANALANSDALTVFDQFVEMISKEGYQPISGVKLYGEIPIGNIESIEGFGADVEGPQQGTQKIEVVQTTTLAGVSVDFEEMMPDLIRRAVDAISEAVLEYSKEPVSLGIALAANIATNFAVEGYQQQQKLIESGYTGNFQIQPMALVAATINPFIEAVNGVTGLINWLLDQIPGVDASELIAEIPLLTREGMESAFDTVIDAMTSAVGGAFVGIANVASKVLGFLADNPALEFAGDALDALAGVSLGVLGDALGLIKDVAGKLGKLVGLNVDGMLDVIDAGRDLVNSGKDAGTALTDAISDLLNGAASTATNIGASVDAAIGEFGDFVKDVARGVDLTLSTEFDFFKIFMDAGIELVQIARFDPKDVEVSYTLDGIDAEPAVIGDAVEFFASGDPGDILDGKAVYSFAGDVDYDYRIKFNITPELTLFGTTVQGEAKFGENHSYEIDFDYAALKTTDDFTLEDMKDLNIGQLFDDALVELPIGLAEELLEVVADSIRESIGLDQGLDLGEIGIEGLTLGRQSTDLDYNELRLFEMEGIEITSEQFSKIAQDFQIELGGARPTPHMDVNFDENDDVKTAVENLLDGLAASSKMARVNGSVLNFGQLMSVMGGDLFVTEDGALVFEDGAENEHLNLGDTKTEVLEFHVLNEDGTLSLLAANIVVNGVNDTPVAVADVAETDEDTQITIDVLANDTDADDGAVLTLVSAEATNGAAAITDNKLVFTPAADYNGAAEITYVMEDEHGAQSTNSVALTIAPVADDVRPEDDSADVSASEATVLNVVANDVEVDGETVSIVSITQPAKGLLEIVSATEVRFTPNQAFDSLNEGVSETVTATITVVDETGAEQVQTLSLNVQGENDAPYALNDDVQTDEDTALLIDILANDQDPDVGGVIAEIELGAPAHGTVELQGNQVLYTPDEDYHGTDQFSYLVRDEFGAESTATVSLTIAPKGEITRQGTVNDDVLTIATLTDGREVIFDGLGGEDVVQVGPRKGQVNLTDAQFVSIETLDMNYGVIRLDDGGILDLSTVGNVINSRGIFAAGGNETIMGSNGTDVISGGLGADLLMGGGGNDVFLLGRGDAMGDTIDGGDGFDVLRAHFFTTELDIAGATIRNIELMDASGTMIDVGQDGHLDLSGVLEIINSHGLKGTDTANHIIASQYNDVIYGMGGNDTLDGQDGDDVFVANTASTGQTSYKGGDGQDTFKLGHEDGTDISGASFESVEVFDANDKTALINGSFDLHQFDFMQNLGAFKGGAQSDRLIGNQTGIVFDGEDGFDFLELGGSVFDHAIAEGEDGTTTITGPNGERYETRNVEEIVFDDFNWSTEQANGPVTSADAIAVNDGAATEIAATALTGNDRDVQDEAFEITSVDAGTSGLALSLNEAGNVVVDTTSEAFDGLAAGEETEARFTYTVTNQRGGTSTETVTATVTGVNDGPLAAGDTFRTDEDSIATGNLLANDSDVDAGAVLTVASVAGASLADGVFTLTLSGGAVVTIGQDGAISVDPTGAMDALAQGETQSESFTYTLQDEHGATSEAHVEITFDGVNDAPTADVAKGDVIARESLTVDAENGVLSNLADVDGAAGDIRLHNVADGTQIEGSHGGTFTLNADGSYHFTAGLAFDDLTFGQTRETSADFQITDAQGGISTQTLSVVVAAPDTSPTVQGDARFDGIVGAEEWTAADQLETIEGDFDQTQSLNVTDILVERLEDATGFDLNALLDFTLIDIDKRIDIENTGENGLSVEVTDAHAPDGALGGIISEVLSFGEDIADGLNEITDIRNALTPIKVTPVFDATVGLDLEFGWDIGLASLGRTSIFQPVGFDFQSTSEVGSGEAFVVNSGNLNAITPTAVTETLGLSSIQVMAGAYLPDTTISDIGLDVRTSDFLGFEIENLASASLTTNHEFSLEEAAETAKKLALQTVEALSAVLPDSLPVDVGELASTILNLDIGNIIEGLFNSDFDFQPLLNLISSGAEPSEMLDEVMAMIQELSASGGDVHKTALLNGVAVSDRHVYDLAIDAMFNDFDGFDDYGTGYFELTDADGSLVTVTGDVVSQVAEVRGVFSKANILKTVVKAAGLSPIEGATVQLDVPVGNAEAITDFSAETPHLLTVNADGTQKIELHQVTDLLKLDIDLDGLGIAFMKQLVKSAETAIALNPTPPTLAALAAAKGGIAFQEEMLNIIEEGVTTELSFDPAKLVAEMVNTMFKAVNLFGNGVDLLVPGPALFQDIEMIAPTDVINALETGLDTANSAILTVTEAIEPLVKLPLEILGVVSDVLTNGLGFVLDGVGEFIDGLSSTLNWAIDKLEDAQDFGISIPFVGDIKPFKAILDVPVEGLKLIKGAVDAGGDAIDWIEGAIDDVNDAIQNLTNFSLTDVMEDGLNAFKDGAIALAEGASMSTTLGITPFDIGFDAALQVTQIAKFDPDNVSATYTFDGYEVDTELGKAVGFYAPVAEAGETVEGSVTYGFSGEMDYEYRLGIDFNPRFTYLGVDLSGALTLGKTDPLDLEFDFDYALAKAGTFEEGNLLSHFDEALLELPLEQLEDGMRDAMDAIWDSIGLDLPGGGGIENGDLVLFKIDDIELTEDQFTDLQRDFAITIVEPDIA